MTKKYPMTRSLPPAVYQVSSNLKRFGNIGFWSQLVLGVISTVSLLFSSTALFQEEGRTPGIEFGIFSALCGLILLSISIFFSFRFGKIGRQIENPDPSRRPKKSETIRLIKIGLTVNVIGMLMSILGSEALVGLVLAKALRLGGGTIVQDPSKLVNSLDLFIIQANTNTIAAHFAGIVSSLWLLNRITR